MWCRSRCARRPGDRVDRPPIYRTDFLVRHHGRRVARGRSATARRQAPNRLAGKLGEAGLPLFAGRVLPFDLACTLAFAALMAKARATGLAIATADGYIAAIVAANGFTVASRDIGPFEVAGVAVINPWQA